MGYASAMAWVLFVDHDGLHGRDREGVATVGALPGRRVPMTTVDGQGTRLEEVGDAFDLGAIPVSTPVRSRPHVKRHRFLSSVGQHAILIAFAAMFLVPFFFIVMTALMTEEPSRHALVHPSSVRVEQLRDGLPSRPVLPIHLEHHADRAPVDARDHPVVRPRRVRPRADALEGSSGGVPARALDVDAPRPGDDRAALRPVGAPGADRPPDAVDPPELPRRRVLDLPVAAVLHDDPRGAVRRRPRGWRERVPDHDARDRAAGEARDRGGRAVQLPLQLERPVLASAVPGAEPEALDADARPHGVPAAARHRVEPHAWRCRS